MKIVDTDVMDMSANAVFLLKVDIICISNVTNVDKNFLKGSTHMTTGVIDLSLKIILLLNCNLMPTERFQRT